MRRINAQAGQKGAVLLVSLFFLLLITLAATTATETSTFQLQMAGNDQSRIDAQQRVYAALDAIADDADNAPVVGGVGYKVCATGSSDNTCDETIITLASAVTTVPTGASMNYYVERMGPLEADAPVMDEGSASSASAFKVARYEVIAEFDGTSARLGKATFVQGMLVRIPSQNN